MVIDSIARYTRNHMLNWGTDHFIGLIALDEMGQKGDADSLAAEWEKLTPQDPLLLCWLARRKHSDGLAAGLSLEARRDPRLALTLEIAAW